MIVSFRSKELLAVGNGSVPKGFPPDVARRPRLLLTLLDAAGTLDDMRSPPGNRLEALSGDRAGQHSVRVNRQWRLCFTWTLSGPADVEFVDYH